MKATFPRILACVAVGTLFAHFSTSGIRGEASLAAPVRQSGFRSALPAYRARQTQAFLHSPLFKTSNKSPLRAKVCVAASNTKDPAFALLFDCDGVIVLTEEMHRIAYNRAFEEFDLRINGKPVVWSVEYYDVLQNTIGGGKPKMKWHFAKNGMPASREGPAPQSEEDLSALVDKLQDAKTVFYKSIVTEVASARPGVLELMDEAIANPHIACGICSAATKEGFEKVVNSVVGPDRLSRLDVVMAGDDVTRKKPDPLIYNLAREKIGLSNDKCVVIEDSIVGLKAAKGAGMKCIITYTSSTKDQPFFETGADAVVEDLSNVKLSDIFF